MDSISKQRNQVYWTRFSNAVVRFSSNPESSKRRRKKLQAMQTQPAKASGDAKCRDRTCLAAATMQKRWSFRRLGLVRLAPGFGQNRRRDDAKTMKLQAPGFGQNRRLGLVRIGAWVSFVASFFFILNSPLLLSSSFSGFFEQKWWAFSVLLKSVSIHRNRF